MRLLICTQAVDKNDPILGFFHRWIEEFAKHTEHVIVLCLRKGEYTLPPNVEVISLGTFNRLQRTLEVCALALGRRREYDAVFVHMNPEYVLAAGWLWRILGKHLVLWYTHKSVDMKLRVAHPFVHAICTATQESFRLPSKKVHVLGHGIDTDFFAPDPHVVRGDHLLSAGRLMKSKRHDLIIRAAKIAQRQLRIAGVGEERAALEKLAHAEGVAVEFLGGITQEQLRDEYRTAAHFIHASETGGLDKVVLEAAACDCNIITTVAWLSKHAPVQSVADTPQAIAEAVVHRARESYDRVAAIRTTHSLASLISRIIWILSKNK